eukprot:Sdes_comp16624_c0_seq1m5925
MSTNEFVETFKRVHPLEFYRKFYEEEIRPDGRELLAFRDAQISVGCIKSADSSALVKLGESSVLCGLKLQLAKPNLLEPCLGFFLPNFQISPACDSNFRKGPPTEREQIMSGFLQSVLCPSSLQESLLGSEDYSDEFDILDRRSLCIQEGELVWSIYCDVMCLGDDGGLKDISFFAIYAALSALLIPAISFDE